MKTKTVKIPIYFGDFTIIFTDDMKDVGEKYKDSIPGKMEPESYSAVVWQDHNSAYTKLYAAFTKKDNAVIAHECVHLVNNLFIARGITADLYNDEPQAYLTGWFFREIENFLNK